jgi:non-heme chloroperoxidase
MPSVTVNNVRINYTEKGTGDEVIVFVHGFAAAVGIWKEVLELLPIDYHAFALDLRGFGQSDKVGSYSLTQFAEDVYGFGQQLGLPKFTYVGHSMGGAIGMKLALDHRDVLKAMVLTASVPAHGMEVPATDAMAQADVMTMMKSMQDASPEAMRGFMALAFTTPPSDERLKEMVDYALSMDMEALTCMGELRSFNLEPRLGEIKVPTLIFAGGKDMIPLDGARRTADRIKGSRLEVFEDNGHMLHMESQNRFVKLLTSFITEVGRG